MSAEATEVTQDSRPIEDRAREMGWYPKEEFHGDVSKWVDAETYVRRGEEFIPFLRANNRKLEQEVKDLRAKTEEQARLIKATNDALAQLETANTEQTREAARAAKADIIDAIAEARREGDVKKELELTEQLEETNNRIKAATTTTQKEPVKQEPTKTQDYTQSPEWQNFVRQNPWWETDEVMRAASLAIGQQLAKEGRLNDLTPEQRFALMARETKKRFGIKDNPRREEAAAVGSPSGAAGRAAGDPNYEKTYSDMPAEARAACDRLASRFVGEGKKHKTAEGWRKEYAAKYFEGT